MQITLVQGLLIALLVFICAFDKHMETFMWFRPLVVAFFTGIILGDVRLGMQAGAVAELSYLGLLTVGGTVPPDPLFAGLMTTVLAYTTGCDVNTALGLAFPFALIGQWINTGTNTFYAGFLPKVDKCAAAGDEKPRARRLAEKERDIVAAVKLGVRLDAAQTFGFEPFEKISELRAVDAERYRMRDDGNSAGRPEEPERFGGSDLLFRDVARPAVRKPLIERMFEIAGNPLFHH